MWISLEIYIHISINPLGIIISKTYWLWPTKMAELAVCVFAILLLQFILRLYPFEDSFANLREKGFP